MTARDRLVLAVVAGVAILGAFWFLMLKPKTEELNTVSAQVNTARSEMEAAQAEIDKGVQAEKSFLDNYAKVARLGKAVPVDDNVSSLVYQINSLAKKRRCDDGKGQAKSKGCDRKVGFTTIQLVPGSAAPAPAPPANADGASAPAAATLPPGAAVGAAGFPTMPFTFNFAGSFFTLQGLFNDINGLVVVDKKNDNAVKARGRLLQIDSITLEPGDDGFPDVNAKISATAYLLPADEGLTGGATPSGPAGAEETPPPADGGATPPPPADGGGDAPSNLIESKR